MIHYIISIAMVCSSSATLIAQEGGGSFADGLGRYLGYLATGVRHAAGDRGNQVILGTALVSIPLLKRYDRSLQRYSQKKGLLPEGVSHVLDSYGGGWAYPMVFLSVGVFSRLTGDSGKEGLGKLRYVVTSTAMTGVVTDLFQRASSRPRPNGASTRSFPSGHTSGSFALAAGLNELYGRSLGVPAYVVAGLVGVQRIHDNKHWLTDVIAGAALGTVIGRGFGVAYREERDDARVSIVPTGTGNEFHLKMVLPLK